MTSPTIAPAEGFVRPIVGFGGAMHSGKIIRTESTRRDTRANKHCAYNFDHAISNNGSFDQFREQIPYLARSLTEQQSAA